MFGYVRPFKSELKIKDYEQFKSVYCGLCHTLKERYGFAARFVINYDFTFLAMLLCNQSVNYKKCRCIASPFKKKRCTASEVFLESSADYSVILTYWKIKDTIRDDGFVEKLKAFSAMFFLKGAYKKARQNASHFDELVCENLKELSALEASKCASIDKAAHKFAEILECTALHEKEPNRQRILKQLFYHTGRIIYLLDAVDDLENDFKLGSYNPLIYRFSLKTDKLSLEERKLMLMTITHSHNFLVSAFMLLDEGIYNAVLENIIFYGIPCAVKNVFGAGDESGILDQNQVIENGVGK